MALVEAARLAMGPALAPGPLAVLKALWSLAVKGDLFREMAVTMGRALLGVALSLIFGTLLGLMAGRMTKALRYTAPLVASLQSCPPIVWISLAMVWAGTGSLVPVATVLASTLPLVFSNSAQGVMSLDPRLEAMGRLFGAPRLRIWRRLILPAMAPYWLAGLSTVLATAWKAAAVAEFMGSHDGVGAKLYWCYAQLWMEGLTAWALALIVLGLTLEALIITPLRRRAASLGAKGAAE
jgi:ABC-type nitrate/sulfonate/bicarbonate transport system permease component